MFLFSSGRLCICHAIQHFFSLILNERLLELASSPLFETFLFIKQPLELFRPTRIVIRFLFPFSFCLDLKSRIWSLVLPPNVVSPEAINMVSHCWRHPLFFWRILTFSGLFGGTSSWHWRLFLVINILCDSLGVLERAKELQIICVSSATRGPP